MVVRVGPRENCSTLGPYYYHWDRDKPFSVGTGTLFDPRTSARVPITRQEAAIVEGILLSRPMGSLDPKPNHADWHAPQTQALVKKLNLQ